jgi:hypothetical protein
MGKPLGSAVYQVDQLFEAVKSAFFKRKSFNSSSRSADLLKPPFLLYLERQQLNNEALIPKSPATSETLLEEAYDNFTAFDLNSSEYCSRIADILPSNFHTYIS